MCGAGNINIDGKKAHLFLGYSGGIITIDGVRYNTYNKVFDMDYAEEKLSREQMFDRLDKIPKKQLIHMILGFVDSAREA